MLRRIVWYKFTDVSEVLTASNIRAMMEAVSTSEMLVNFYQTTRLSIPQVNRIFTIRVPSQVSYTKSLGIFDYDTAKYIWMSKFAECDRLKA
jgi:hypothetical protein